MKTKPLVFVVEDDRIFQEILVHHLSLSFSINVLAFISGEECLANMYRKPDIIILDNYLLNTSGLEVLKAIKADGSDSYILVISSEDVAAESIENGAYDFILKDDNALDKIVEKIELFQNIREAIQLRKRRLSIMGIFQKL